MRRLTLLVFCISIVLRGVILGNVGVAIPTTLLNKTDQSISFESIDSKTYGDETFNLEATASSGLVVIYTSSNTDVATISGNTVTIVGTGSTTITASQPGNDTYNAAPDVEQDLTVNKAILTAKADDKTRDYGQANPAFTITYTGFAYADDASDITAPTATTNATQSSDAGEYQIVLSGGSSNNYDLSSQDGTLTIEKVDLMATADDTNRKYGEENPQFTISYEGFVNGDDKDDIAQPQASTSANKQSDVGDYPITLSGGGATNYNISVASGTLTVTQADLMATADDQNRGYGAENPMLTISYTGFANGESEADITPPVASTSATTASPVGEYEISLSGGSATNYAITTSAGTLTVSEATLRATADDKNRAYGNDNPELTVSYDGFVNGDGAGDITAPSISTSATTESNAGTYDIVLSGGSAGNYSLELINGTLTVEQATLTATAEDKQKTYGTANPEFTIVYQGFVNGDGLGDITEPAASSAADESSHSGAYDISLSGGTADNYAFEFVTGMLTVTKASVTATANDTQREKGQANPVFTIRYSGFVDGDDMGDLDILPTASSTADATSNRGTYDIVPSGGSDNNYEFEFENGTLTVVGPVYTLPQSISFEATGLGLSSSQSLTIENTGDGPLRITSINLPDGFETDVSGLVIAIGASDQIPLTFSPTEARSYGGNMEIVSNNGTDQITLSGTGEVVTSLDDGVAGVEFEMYPNPARKLVTIHFANQIGGEVKLRIMDISGRAKWQHQLRDQNHVEVNLNSYESGVYMVIAETRFGTVVKKLLIQK